MNIIGKGQVDGVEQGDILGQVAFIARLSRVAASAEQESGFTAHHVPP